MANRKNHKGGYTVEAFKYEFYEFVEQRRSENGKRIYFTHPKYSRMDFYVNLTNEGIITEQEFDRVYNIIHPLWLKAKKNPEKYMRTETVVTAGAPQPEQHFTVRMGDKPYGLTVDSKGNEITLRHTDVPFIEHRFTHDGAIDSLADPERRNALSAEFQKHIEELASGILGLDAMRDIWRDKIGGQTSVTQHAISFSHPLLKEPRTITRENPIAPETLSQFMQETSTALFERQTMRMARMKRLEDRGYSVNIVHNKQSPFVHIAHEDPGFAPRDIPLHPANEVFVADPKEEIEELERLYIRKTDLERLKREREEKDKRSQKAAAREEAKKPKPIQKVIYILDATVLANLCYERGKPDNKRTWLDIIHVLEALPSTKYVIVPSIVADWEMLGRMPLNRDSKDPQARLKQIDTRESIIEKWRLRDTDEYFKRAHRVALMPDGSQEWIHPTKYIADSSKLIVWESQQQHEFYNNMMNHIKRYEGNKGKKNPVVLARILNAKNAGEDACMRIARSIGDKECPVYIVSDDHSFRYSYEAGLKTGNIHTYGMRGIATLGTPQLIRRLSIAYENDLSGALHNISEQPEEPINADDIFREINATHSRHDKRPLDLLEQHVQVRAIKPDKTPEESLYKVLLEGVAEERRLKEESARSLEAPLETSTGKHSARYLRDKDNKPGKNRRRK